MLARIAGNCLWLARYLERAENTARLTATARWQSLQPEFAAAEARPWTWALAVAADPQAYAELQPAFATAAVLDVLVVDHRNPSSLWSCFRAMRENARTARPWIGNGLWEAISTTWIEARAFDHDILAARGLEDVLSWSVQRCQLIRGASEDLFEDDVPQVLAIGRALERFDYIARLLRAVLPEVVAAGAETAKPGTPGYRLWQALLDAAGVNEVYRRLYPAVGNLAQTVALIATHPRQPRSLVASAARLATATAVLANGAETASLSAARALYAAVHAAESAPAELLAGEGGGRLLSALVASGNQLAGTIVAEHCDPLRQNDESLAATDQGAGAGSSQSQSQGQDHKPGPP